MAYFVLLSIFQRNIPPSETSPVLGKIRCCPQNVVAAIETQKTSQFLAIIASQKQVAHGTGMYYIHNGRRVKSM